MKKMVLLLLITLNTAISYTYETNKFPYTLDLLRDTFMLSAGTLGSGVSFFLGSNRTSVTDTDIQNLLRNNISSFDRPAIYNWSPLASTASDILLYTMVSLPVLLTVSPVIDSQWEQVSIIIIMYAETLLFNFGLNNSFKRLIGRGRPYLYNTNITLTEKIKAGNDPFESFYSGHTCFTFGSAVFLAKVFSDIYPDSPWKYAVWVASLTTATSAGILRFIAGKHFPTDVVAGAIIGSIIGFMIPMIHEEINIQGVSIVPQLGENTGFALSIKI